MVDQLPSLSLGSHSRRSLKLNEPRYADACGRVSRCNLSACRRRTSIKDTLINVLLS